MKTTSSWNIKGLIYALIGILLDGAGIFLTKKGFIHFEGIDGVTANAVRCFGAVFFYFIVSLFFPLNIISKFKELPQKIRYQPILFSFTGTFLSLFFYLNAVKMAALSIVTAISVTGPIFTTVMEFLIEKRKPSKIHYIALCLFLFAFYLNFSVKN